MIETLLLVLALSLDAFVASIAYGTSKIKIPLSSITLMSIICSSFLAISLFLGSVVKNFIPDKVTSITSFVILLVLGVYYLFESLIKTYLRKQQDAKKKLQVNICNLCFVLDIYLDETKADINHSKNLNAKESMYLATALSLDSIAVGFAGSLGSINYIQVIICSLICGFVSIIFGAFLGRKIVEKSNLNLSWLSGLLLIILAFKNLF